MILGLKFLKLIFGVRNTFIAIFLGIFFLTLGYDIQLGK